MKIKYKRADKFYPRRVTLIMNDKINLLYDYTVKIIVRRHLNLTIYRDNPKKAVVWAYVNGSLNGL